MAMRSCPSTRTGSSHRKWPCVPDPQYTPAHAHPTHVCVGLKTVVVENPFCLSSSLPNPESTRAQVLEYLRGKRCAFSRVSQVAVTPLEALGSVSVGARLFPAGSYLLLPSCCTNGFTPYQASPLAGLSSPTKPHMQQKTEEGSFAVGEDGRSGAPDHRHSIARVFVSCKP
jgi:hypothetical protein